jgi:hypothetical protein
MEITNHPAIKTNCFAMHKSRENLMPFAFFFAVYFIDRISQRIPILVSKMTVSPVPLTFLLKKPKTIIFNCFNFVRFYFAIMQIDLIFFYICLFLNITLIILWFAREGSSQLVINQKLICLESAKPQIFSLYLANSINTYLEVGTTMWTE